jgi:site-specific DNA-methyltransferase (adenine-specific)
MKPDWTGEGVELRCGDCLSVMSELPESSVDTILTDPPYGLTANKKGGTGQASLNVKSPAGRSRVTTGGFMGCEWDHGVPGAEFWNAALRVAKPGAMLLAFGGTRTHHRLVCAIEDAGWEIRDCIMWVYGSGFPKSMNISKAIDKAAGAERKVIGQRTYADGTQGSWRKSSSSKYAQDDWTQDGTDRPKVDTAPATDAAKEWDGWGTALKPAYEPICVAMKPLDGTFANNAALHGMAGLNIDGCRVPSDGEVVSQQGSGGLFSHIRDSKPYPRGRDGEETADKRYTEEGSSNFAATPGPRGGAENGRWPANLIHDGSDEVVDLFPVTTSGTLTASQQSNGGFKGAKNCYGDAESGGIGYYPASSGSAARFFYCAKASKSERGEGNNHPTVKPLSLMEYLCRLTSTPNGGIVLDPFMGSASTGVAAIREGRKFIGIEQDAKYFDIARERIERELREQRIQPKLF